MKRALVPALAGLSLLVVLALGSGGAGAARTATAVGSADRVVLFSSDGMRPDLMDKYSDAGSMPTYAALRRAGVEGDNGMTQAFPPNTGVGWYTMATGAYPGEHGSTNNTFHRTGESNFNNSRTPPSARVRRSRRSSGSAAGTPASTGRPSTSPTSSLHAASSPHR
jgi:predicted AlkP superfamily pyrophosphatase or phosphodiesterase